ncbi:MAG: hypothetical protein O9284_10145 [Steroidobacteraceae bacterium]|nr:hypothetical protein [Steroidobacteraceae bacterium]
MLAALPRVDGYITVPVIVMSGDLEPATCRRFVRAGATDAVGDDVLAAGGLGVAVENARERRAQQQGAAQGDARLLARRVRAVGRLVHRVRASRRPGASRGGGRPGPPAESPPAGPADRRTGPAVRSWRDVGWLARRKTV